jgi:hypothetical protein
MLARRIEGDMEEDNEPAFISATPYIITDTQKYPITGPKSGTYYYHVRSENEIGHSPWSNIVSVTLPFPLYIPMLRKDPSPTPTPTATKTPTVPTVTNTPTPTNTPTHTPTYTPTPCLTMEDEDSYPNNLRSEAANNPSVCENVWLTGALPNDDPQDYHKIEVSNSGTLKVDLSNIPQGTDYDLYLYDSNNPVPIAESTQTNDSECIQYDVLPGFYYLRVFPYQGRSDDEYLLKWQLNNPVTCPTVQSLQRP